jgi:hypothetical protein
LIGFLLTGCDIIDTRSELAIQVDELIDSPNSDIWVESKGRFYYPISNGAIRVKSDGEVSLVTNLDGSNNYSIITVANPNGTRAAKIAKKFGVSKLTKAAIDSSQELQTELMKDAIILVSNAVKTSMLFESPESGEKP